MHTSNPDLPTPEQLCADRFERGATQRSAPYREGFLAGARRAAAGKPGTGGNPYRWGTAHADAWSAGADEGKARFEWVARKQTHHNHTGTPA